MATPVCAFFLKGQCNFGDGCRFKHPPLSAVSSPIVPPALQTTTSPASLCPHFQRGNCRFGDTCRLLHGPAVRPATTSTAVAPQEALPPFVCPHFKRGACLFGAQCRLSHVDAKPPAAQLALPSAKAGAFGGCKFFAQGACNKGAVCPFPHDHDGLPSAAATWRNTTLPPGVQRSALGECKFFAKGTRTKGASCPFSHSGLPSALPVSHNPVPHPGTSPVGRSSQRTTFGGCKFFQQGSCTKGSACSFAHDGVSDSMSQERPKSLSKPSSTLTASHTEANAMTSIGSEIPVATVRSHVADVIPTGFSSNTPVQVDNTRTLFGCDVKYSAGAIIQSITTSFESTRLVISDLPKDFSHAALIELLEPFGSLKSAVMCDPVASPGLARVEFLDANDAAQAVQSLQGKQIRLQKLTARLDLRRGATSAPVLQSNKVKVSWFRPSCIAWAHFPSSSGAQAAAKRLNGKMLDGRKVSAKFQTPSLYQTKSFSVEFKGLPVSVTGIRLIKWGNLPSVQVGEPSYNADTTVDSIRTLLRERGHLDAFDQLPVDNSKAKLTAFAQFSSADSARQAVQELHNRPRRILRNSPLFLEAIHAIKISVPRAHFVVIREIIDEFRDQLESCRLRYYGQNEAGGPADPVTFRIYGPDAKAVGQARIRVEQILDGELLSSEGTGVWDEYFVTQEGKAFLSACADVGAFAKVDGRGARTKILVRVAMLNTQKHIILADDPLLPLVMRRLQKLHEAASPGKLSFNMIARKLVVRGDDADVRRVRLALLSLTMGIAESMSTTSTSCPVCLDDVSDIVRLSCGHAYCRQCLQLLLESAAGPAFTPDSLKCLQQLTDDTEKRTCAALVSLDLIRHLLSPALETQLMEASFLSYIHERPDEFHYCPTPDCEIIYRSGPAGTALQCPKCQGCICPACHTDFHEGLTCAEHRDNMTGGHDAYQRWKEENGVKACPKCKTDMQKNGGCNHMTCIRCKVHICWVCMRTFDDTDTSGGVYGHMQREHGGMY